MYSFEKLEPRILLSADLLPLVTDTQTIEAPDASVLHVSILENSEIQALTEDTSTPPPQEESNLKTAATEHRTEIIFINDDLEDPDALLTDINQQDGQKQVFLLDSSVDGIQQITDILATNDSIDAIHFISHGTDGNVKLGNTWLSSENLAEYAESISFWGNSLAEDGDILFYGCDLASVPGGLKLLDAISSLAGADVAASTDATGHRILGGDWVLEYRLGEIEAETPLSSQLQNDWVHILAEESVADNFNTLSYNNNTGTLSWTGGWVEIGETTNPTAGNVRIESNKLSIRTADALETTRGISRVVDLSTATSAFLSFDYQTIPNEEAGQVMLQIRAEGDPFWHLEKVYWTNWVQNDSAYVDLSDYISAATEIRFISSNNFFEGGNSWGKDTFIVDNLQIDFTTQTQNTITGGTFNAENKTITLTGTNFTFLGDIGDNVKSNLDWSKFSWDINGDNGLTPDISFIVNNFSQVLVTNATTLTLNLTAQKTTEILATTGYGAFGGLDTLDISTGFSGNGSGGYSTTDGLSDGPLTTITLPVITGDNTGNVTEDIDPESDGLLETSGVLTFSDPDVDGSSFIAETITGSYGQLDIDSAGNWSYSADNTQTAIQRLDVSEDLTDTFTVSAADGTIHNVLITINGAEDIPTVDNPIGDKTATENIAFSFTFAGNTFNDVDASDTLIYLATLDDDSPLPSWLNFDEITRTFNGTPASVDIGVFSIKITADDGTSNVSAIFVLTVDSATHAPVISGDNTGSVIEDIDSDLDGLLETTGMLTVIDPDPDESNFVAETIVGTYGKIIIDSAGNWGYAAENTQLAIQQLDASETLTDTITVTTTDGSTHDINITINGAEDAPTLDHTIDDQTATEDAVFSFTLAANTFTDIDASDTLNYSSTLDNDSPLPTWLNFDPASRTFSGTPDNGDVGTINIKVTVTDSTSSVSDIFALAVTNSPDLPLIGGIATGSVTEDNDPESNGLLETSGVLTISDPDAGESSFIAETITGSYGQLDIDSAGSWSYSADNTQAAIQRLDITESLTDTLTVTTTDGTTHDVLITINGAEDAPTLDHMINDRTAAEDAAFSFTLSANTFTDVDVSDMLTYSATFTDNSALPAWLGFNAATRTFSGIPANGDVGTISVKVTASDGTTTVSGIFNLTVNNTNDPPTLDNAITNQTAMQDAAFTFSFAANTFSDVDVSDMLTYSATLTDNSALPAWLGFNAATRTFSGTPANGDVGTISVKVTASDGIASVADSFNLTVNKTNDPPTLDNAITDQTATEDAAFTFSFAANTFSDVDVSDILTYSATLADNSALPAWLGFDSATRTFSGTPANNDVGTISVTVTANDGITSVSDSFNLTVNNTNDPPTLDNAITDQTATEDTAFSFNVPADSFSDIDVSDILSYTATLDDGTILPTWLSFDPTTLTFSGTPANGDIGTIRVKVTADDGTSTIADIFTLTVNNTPAGAPSDNLASTPHLFLPEKVVTTLALATPTDETAPADDEPLSSTGLGLLQQSSYTNRTDDTGLPAQTESLNIDVSFRNLIDSNFNQKLAKHSTNGNSHFAVDDYNLQSLDYQPRTALEYDTLRSTLDAFREETEHEAIMGRTIVGSAIAASTGLSAGYVVWMLRSGALLSSLLSSLPAWQLADPLAILVGSKNRSDEDDDDSIEAIIANSPENSVKTDTNSEEQTTEIHANDIPEKDSH